MAQKDTVTVSDGWSPRVFLECGQTYEYAGWDWALRALTLPGDGGRSNPRPCRAAGANPEGCFLFFFPRNLNSHKLELALACVRWLGHKPPNAEREFLLHKALMHSVWSARQQWGNSCRATETLLDRCLLCIPPLPPPPAQNEKRLWMLQSTSLCFRLFSTKRSGNKAHSFPSIESLLKSNI